MGAQYRSVLTRGRRGSPAQGVPRAALVPFPAGTALLRAGSFQVPAFCLFGLRALVSAVACRPKRHARMTRGPLTAKDERPPNRAALRIRYLLFFICFV